MPWANPAFLKPQLLFKAKVPDLTKYVGKTVNIEGKKIKIERIVGNLTKPAFYEINGEHLVNMLRFHAQMEGAKDISEDDFKAFEEMTMECEKLPTGEKKNDPGVQ